jgi:glycine cleavage system transcriptional repressor
MIIITATGRDRPGMVAAISQKLFEADCNIEDATMTRLSGEFAMILVVAPPPELSTPDLAARLFSLRESHGLRVVCNDLEDEQPSTTPPATRFILSA